jgi:hypothetical protein
VYDLRPTSGRDARSRFGTWWGRPTTVLLVALVVVLLLVSTTVLATLAVTGGSTETLATTSPVAPPSPSPSETTPPPTAPRATEALPSPTPPGVSASPGGDGVAVLPPVPSGPGVPVQSGAHEDRYPGPNSSFDFDSNSDRNSVDSSRTDIAISEYGLTGVNGVNLTKAPRARPRLADCAGVGPEKWVLDAPARELAAGLTLCFFTSENRYGYLQVQAARRTNGGFLDSITFNFLVWAGPND